jgi:hypothetical protein
MQYQQSSELHPNGWGNVIFLERGDCGVAMLLRLPMMVRNVMVRNELTCHATNLDGSNGSCDVFASRECDVGPNDERFNSTIVSLVAVYLADNRIRTAHRLYHPNGRHAVGKIVQFGSHDS